MSAGPGLGRLLLPLALAACGRSADRACEDYISAANDCIHGSPDGLVAVFDADEFCAPYVGLKGDDKQAAREAFECATEVYETADCSDAAGIGDAAVEATICVGGP